jgi:hypothetical protein
MGDECGCLRSDSGLHKVEPYLTFANIPRLERQSADIQSEVDEPELLNQSVRNSDKLKDDTIL